MCGIVGIVNCSDYRFFDIRETIQQMTQTLSRRGPDDQGCWIDQHEKVALGHRRLSIIDLSKNAVQPMSSADNKYCLVFNGEIYNYLDIKNELQKQGVVFKTSSDTEVLLEAVGFWGIKKSLQKFNGMFAFAVWDKQENILHLARDRNGEKPLYLGYVKNSFVFASELKAFYAHPQFDSEINIAIISQFLNLGYISAPHSIYKNIYKLEKACFISIGFGEQYKDLRTETGQALLSQQSTQGIKLEKYWFPQNASSTSQDIDCSVDYVEKLIADSIQYRTHSDVPIGALLSGGLDSSTVVALLQSQSQRPVRTFTIGFDDEVYNEAQYAREIAGILGTEHTEVIVNESMALDVVEKLPYIYDEPFADSSQIPTLLISKVASESVKVVMSGDGGDEVFAGYNRHLWAPLIWNKLKKIHWTLRYPVYFFFRNPSEPALGYVDKILKGINSSAVHDRHGKIKKTLLLLSAKSRQDMYFKMISVYQGSLQAVARHHRKIQMTNYNLKFEGDDYQKSMILNDLNGYLSDDILTKVDRASMYYGLEVRVPFIDHRLIEHMLAIPSDKKIRNGQTKWYLREILAKHIPRKLLERPKMGFAVPLDKWLRGPLKELGDRLLDSNAIIKEGILDPVCVKKLWHSHLSGRYNHGGKLWNIIMLRMWLEVSQVKR